MKRCPSCERTYTDDALSFCPNDGTPLVTDTPPASFDPQATIMASPPKVSGPTDWPSQPPPAQSDWSAPQPPAQSSGWGDTPGGYQPGGYQPGSQVMPSTGFQPPPPPPFPGAAQKQQGLAVASLVCGILSVCCVGFLTGIPAIILGVMAMNKEKTDPEHYGGKGMALAGVIMGGFSIVISLIWIVVQIIGATMR
jgi:hypothetical protein